MTPNECIELCEYIHAAVPHQQWAPGTPDVWWDLGLSEVAYGDAKEAVRGMVRGRVFIDYQGIVEAVRKLRVVRLAGVDSIQPPADLNPDDTVAFQAWQRATIAAVARGDIVPPAPSLPGPPPPEIQALLEGVGRRVPRQ